MPKWNSDTLNHKHWFSTGHLWFLHCKATFNPVWSLFVSWVIGRGILPSTVSSVGVGEVLVTISLGVTITTFPVIEWLTNFKSVGFCLLSSFPELLHCQLVSDQMIHVSKVV